MRYFCQFVVNGTQILKWDIFVSLLWTGLKSLNEIFLSVCCKRDSNPWLTTIHTSWDSTWHKQVPCNHHLIHRHSLDTCRHCILCIITTIITIIHGSLIEESFSTQAGTTYLVIVIIIIIIFNIIVIIIMMIPFIVWTLTGTSSPSQCSRTTWI